MHVAVKIGSSDTQSSENDGENNERITDTHPLKYPKEIETQVGKCSSSSSRGLFAQCLVSAVIAIATVGSGMPIGFSAILLPQLKSPNESLQIDDEMGSWIASIHSAATPIGSLLSGTMMDYFGRKVTLQLAGLPLILGWIIISFCQNHALLLLGRVFAGLSVGLVAPVGQVYLAEISDPKMRGVFTSIPFSSYSFGILLVYMLGSTVHWRLVSGLSIILPAVAMIMYFFLPESPAWLVRKDRIEQANKACLWLRGGNVVQSKLEIQQLINRAENEKLQKENSQSIWKYIFKPQVLKPFFIINTFSILQTLAGVYLIVFYAVEIISNMGEGDNKIDKFFAAILTAGVRFIFAVISSVLLAFCGRRVVGIGSALSTGLAALILAMLLYSDCPQNAYFIAIWLLAYVGANTAGLMILPGVMVGELYPIKVRGLAGSITFTIFNLLIFAITKLFPYLKTLLSICGFFLLFGISSFVTAAFFYCFLPETKGKTLNEIEDYFLEDNWLWITRKVRRQEELCTNNNIKT